MTEYDIKSWEHVNGAISLGIGDIDKAISDLLASDNADFGSHPNVKKVVDAAAKDRFYVTAPPDIGGVKASEMSGPEAKNEMLRWMRVWEERLRNKFQQLKNVSAKKYEPYWRSPLDLYNVGDDWRKAAQHGQPVPTEVSEMDGGQWKGSAADAYRGIVKDQAGATNVMAGLVSTTGQSMLNASAGVQGLFNSYLVALQQIATDLRGLPGGGLGGRRRAAIQWLDFWIKFVDETLFGKDQNWKKTVADAHDYLRKNGTLTGALQYNQWPSSKGDVDLSDVKGTPGQAPPPGKDSVAPVPADGQVPQASAAGGRPEAPKGDDGVVDDSLQHAGRMVRK